MNHKQRMFKAQQIAAQQQRLIDAFNDAYPVGTTVELLKDDDSVVTTKTRSAAWLMGGHSAMVMVEGVSGGYSLDRVKVKRDSVTA